MKKHQLSQRKISVANNLGKSQTKISSFFTKIPKGAVDNDKISNINSSVLIERKRKERDNEFDKESEVNVKRKCNVTKELLKEHLIVTVKNINSHESSVLKDLKDSYYNSKENKNNIVLQKFNNSENNLIKNEQSVNVCQKSASIKNINNSDVICSDSHVLKKTQELNSVTLELSPSAVETTMSEKIELCDLKEIESFENFSSMMNGDELDNFVDQEWHPEIDFTTLQRCKISDVKRESTITILTVQHLASEGIDTVACSGFWKDIQIQISDIVTIQARKDLQYWIVDNNNGLIVTQPDLLISGTTITSGLFCNRRAVLAEKFKKIESLPNLSGDYSVMTVGSLVHEWLQKALQENIFALSDVIKLLDNILQSKDTISYLYASDLSLVDCRKRMMEYAPRIFEFIQHYIKGNKQQHISNLKNNFQGSINSIQDIEENVYIPKLGIKGRVDVTAEVNINSKKRIMPLEVKTGRVSHSFEHKGQVILYLMMMSFWDQDIDTGLLLYLKENVMQEIKSKHHEKRDLILLRNTLAYYFTKKPADQQNINLESDLKTMELPEPINHHSACSRCPYQTLCCAYLMKDENTNLSLSHPLSAFIEELRSDFNISHLNYIMKWIALLQLEESYVSSNSSLSSLWTTSPEKREAKGTCICNLKVIGKPKKKGSTRQIHPLLTCKSEEYAVASCDSPEDLEVFYNSKRIVGVTCYGAYHALIRKRNFDVCVVDESAQIMQPTILRPLYSARKFVLVGDPDQLPPIIKNKTALKLGADESLFVRLDNDDNTINLSKQYRMNRRIMKLANDLTYRDKLTSGSKQVENATLTGSKMEQVFLSCERWVRSTLSRSLEDSVVVLNTDSTYNLSTEFENRDVISDQAYSNIWEVAVILRLTQVLIEGGVCARNIGIIAPYNAQINLLRKIIGKEIEVNTVDQYQGRDKDVILYSCTKSIACNIKKEFEILDDQRRLTVAITRARHKLIIIADKVTLLRYLPFKNLFDVIDEKNVINLHDGEEDFNWKSLINGIDN
ncbi:DNA replication ATP-dependent helicase/nuclease DNA2 isoform X3 [Cardiocondyla obscurior]|uniref:DNA replication ATP-dependent helicase/nuclease DNA2 isoform X3 n=1 Tax=Cardiocondyla obscurior TaxID=286306 RepID=UPI0039656FDA